jgi:hypothetical protein
MYTLKISKFAPNRPKKVAKMPDFGIFVFDFSTLFKFDSCAKYFFEQYVILQVTFKMLTTASKRPKMVENSFKKHPIKRIFI